MKHHLKTTFLALLGLLALAACGGGGGGSAVAPKVWGTAALIEADNAGGADSPQIAFDASGNALAVWTQPDGTRYSIWANRYTAATNTWGTAALIETDNAGDAFGPQIAFDPSGNAIVVWYQSDGTRTNIWSSRYTAATGIWGTAVLIEADNGGDASYPQIAVDASGNALAVWHQYDDSTPTNIWSSRYTAATGIWGTAVLIETDNAGGAFGPQIVFDASGNALAVWTQFDGTGTRNSIWANRYTAATGIWGTAALIETDNAGDAYNPQIAIDASGNALAVWYQHNGTRYNIWANRYTAATHTWGTAVLIEAGDAGHAFSPQVAIDANGNALAVWPQSDGSQYHLFGNRYTAATNTWGTAVRIENAAGEFENGPNIAIDTNGNAIVVWAQNFAGLRNDTWAVRYTAGTGWGTAQLIENNDAGDTDSSANAIDANGNALAVWTQFDGTRYNIWANRFQ